MSIQRFSIWHYFFTLTLNDLHHVLDLTLASQIEYEDTTVHGSVFGSENGPDNVGGQLKFEIVRVLRFDPGHDRVRGGYSGIIRIL